MKKTILAVGLVASAATCHAQSSGATIYGIIDAGVERINNVGVAGDSLTRMPNQTGSTPSRIGFRGTEDLGAGLKAVYTLEAGYGTDSGTLGQGGRLFGRQAFVGVGGRWGTVTLGRQYTMLFWSILDADILGANLHSSGAIDSYIPNARMDNMISYKGSFNGLTVGAAYSPGRDSVNAGPSPAGTNCAGENAADTKACKHWSALLKYDTPTWGVASARDHMNGGAGAFAGLTKSSLSDTRTTLNGYVRFGQSKIGGGLMRRDNEGSVTPKSDLLYVGISHPISPSLTIESQVLKYDVKNSANEALLLVLRGTWNFSPRTAAYASLAKIDNDGSLNFSVSCGAAGANPVAGGSQSGLMVGLRHTF